jgi:hypothetical protein
VCIQGPPSGIGQAVTFFEKTLKKVAISPNPLWPALKLKGYVMSKFKTSRILASIPFLLIGSSFLIGSIWLGIDRLLGGFEWKENDGFIVGWIIALIIFGGAFLQFGKDALYKGHSEKSSPLVGPKLYYIIGVLILIPGIWSFIAGSQQALMIVAFGLGSIIYGAKLSMRLKKQTLSSEI